MTIALTWIRKTKTGDELIFASDSRLTGGSHVDMCQKVFPFPRNDCAIAFAGSTAIAYPFILQIMSIISNHRKLKDRTTDFCKVPTIIRNSLNAFVDAHKGFDEDTFLEELRHTEFLIGGWSSIYQKFIIRRLSYHNGNGKYVLVKKIGVSLRWGLEKKDLIPIAFIGDHIPDILERLQPKLEVSGALHKLALNYEPLEVLDRMLLDPAFSDRNGKWGGKIGGHPQVLKVYRRCQSLHFKVRRISDPSQVFFQGRPVMKFEEILNPVIDIN